MQRCWLKGPEGPEGDALHAVLCAAGYNLRWLLRAIARKGLRVLFVSVSSLAVLTAWLVSALRQPRNLAVMASN